MEKEYFVTEEFAQDCAKNYGLSSKNFRISGGESGKSGKFIAVRKDDDTSGGGKSGKDDRSKDDDGGGKSGKDDRSKDDDNAGGGKSSKDHDRKRSNKDRWWDGKAVKDRSWDIASRAACKR